jgi:hypothetical protein
MDWLNGALVWAVADSHQAAYLFPRDCPRILMWPTAETNGADLERWIGNPSIPMVAYLEEDWVDSVRSARLFRYVFDASHFEPVPGDEWMMVSRDIVTPLREELIDDLAAALRHVRVDLRIVSSLEPLREAWNSTVHVSGIRLRNSRSWRG